MSNRTYGVCVDEAEYRSLIARRDDIDAECNRLAERGLDHCFALLAYMNQTKNEMLALDRDIIAMGMATGRSLACRKGRRVPSAGLCRDCMRFEDGIERLGGRSAATHIQREPGDELEPWVLGWIAGLDGLTECAFSGAQKAEWEWWRERAVEWMDGKTREQVRAEIKAET